MGQLSGMVVGDGRSPGEHEDWLAHVERSDAVGADNDTSFSWRDLRHGPVSQGSRSAFGSAGALSAPAWTPLWFLLGSQGVEIAAALRLLPNHRQYFFFQ